MQLKTIIYTTDQSLWIRKEFGEIYNRLRYVKGLEVQEFLVEYIDIKKLPKNVLTLDYYQTLFKKGCNAVIIHTSRKDRDKYGIVSASSGKPVRGFAYRNQKDGWCIAVHANEGEKTREWDKTLTDFQGTTLHEFAHAISMMTGVTDRTHEFDYDYKLTTYLQSLSFERWNLLKELSGLLTTLRDLLIKQIDDRQVVQTNYSRGQLLLGYANASLGLDASPRGLAPNELACAESVSELIRKVLPDFPVITGTYTLWERLKTDKRFMEVDEPQAGDIVISPTGTSTAKIVGHTGIMKTNKQIMSNSSNTGLWTQNYTVTSWANRWGVAGYPILYYRII